MTTFVRRGPKRDRPLLIILAAGFLAIGLTGTLLLFSFKYPEAFLIGLPGQHDKDARGLRLALCLDCHVPFVGTPGSRCLGPGCHGELATGTPPRTGPAMPIRFHVALRSHACTDCHREHTLHRPEPSTFEHGIIPKTTREQCGRCHGAGQADNHAPADTVRCGLCHSVKAWAGAKANHKRLTEEACDLCHSAPETRSHASVAGTCTACHHSQGWHPTGMEPESQVPAEK